MKLKQGKRRCGTYVYISEEVANDFFPMSACKRSSICKIEGVIQGAVCAFGDWCESGLFLAV